MSGTWAEPAVETRRPLTFDEFADAWVRERRTATGNPLREKSAAEYRRQLKKGLGTFGGHPINDITLQQVTAWHAKRAAEAPTAAGAEARLLRAILNTAVEYGLIDRVPVPSNLTKSSANRHHRPPTNVELRDLVQCMTPRYRLGLIMAAYAGLRLSEWRALRRGDLELQEGRYAVTVGRQAQHINGTGWVVGDPKSARGCRTLVLPGHQTLNVDQHLREFVGTGQECLLFPPRGSSAYFHDSDFNKEWNRARDAVGVRGEVREHDLRSWYCSSLFEVGASSVEVRDAMGHANLRTTEQHYLYSLSDRRARWADQLPPLSGMIPPPNRVEVSLLDGITGQETVTREEAS